MNRPSISIVVPVLNEARGLASSLARLGDCAAGLGAPFEIVCVDDGSCDESLGVMLRAAARDGRIRVLRHDANRGKGAAVRTGVLAARGELVVFLDADLSTDLEALPRALDLLRGGADVVLGDRYGPGARVLRRQRPARAFLGGCFRRAASWLVDGEVRDFTCGFKGFRAPAARAIFARARIERWVFDVELVVIARELGLRLEQVGVRWSDSGSSRVRVLSAIASSLRDLVRIALGRANGAYASRAASVARPLALLPKAPPAPLPARRRHLQPSAHASGSQYEASGLRDQASYSTSPASKSAAAM